MATNSKSGAYLVKKGRPRRVRAFIPDFKKKKYDDLIPDRLSIVVDTDKV